MVKSRRFRDHLYTGVTNGSTIYCCCGPPLSAMLWRRESMRQSIQVVSAPHSTFLGVSLPMEPARSSPPQLPPGPQLAGPPSPWGNSPVGEGADKGLGGMKVAGGAKPLTWNCAAE